MWINGKLKEHRDAAKVENRILCDRSMRIQTNPEPSKTIYPQTNKQTQTVYLIASKPLFYIKEAENKKATGGEVSGLRTEKLGKLFPCENVRVDF